ncbi:hypothetical protein BC834DRAFT_924157 [Gloeopeniophorella convolvens]|nr:hypothetical protein BC834DRAFT_924157 [Gloeopeniophorella convolvens]
MATTDAVAIFAEGTFEDQINEFAEYISQSRPEPERAPYVESIQEKLVVEEGQTPLVRMSRGGEIFLTVLDDVKGLARALSETKKRVSDLLPTIAASPAEPAIKYRILTNLFNALPRTSALRLPVYTTLVELASANDELHVLHVSRADVEKWLGEWAVPADTKAAFLQTLADVFDKASQPETAHYYRLTHVRALGGAAPAAQPAALAAISAALSDPAVLDFDALFKLDAVVAASAHPLFALLRVFLTGGLDDLRAWQGANAGVAETHGLDAAQLERKIRLLALADLGFQNIGQDLPYAQVAAALQVDPAHVERWVIDAIRAGLLTGKLAQPSQTLRVTRATARTFGKSEWALLARRLAGWRAGLAGVLEVVAAARRRNDAVAAVVAPAEKQAEGGEVAVEAAA